VYRVWKELSGGDGRFAVMRPTGRRGNECRRAGLCRFIQLSKIGRGRLTGALDFVACCGVLEKVDRRDCGASRLKGGCSQDWLPHWEVAGLVEALISSDETA